MNYRHEFHAGNPADVFKHIVLIETLAALAAKDKPLCVFDTHAGNGRYRLARTGEWQRGIGQLWPERARWPGLARYFAALAVYNRGAQLAVYPGSPLLIAQALRPQDRAVCYEVEAEAHSALLRALRAHRQVTLYQADAYRALAGVLPPREKRGLVLIDPPYEQPREFTDVAQLLAAAWAHFRSGTHLLWYPLKARRPVAALKRAVRALEAEALALEFLWLPEDNEQRLNGCGMLLLNAPWKLPEALRDLLDPVAQRLAGPAGQPQVRLETV